MFRLLTTDFEGYFLTFTDWQNSEASKYGYPNRCKLLISDFFFFKYDIILY